MFPHDIGVRVHYASAYAQEAITTVRVPDTGTKPRDAFSDNFILGDIQDWTGGAPEQSALICFEQQIELETPGIPPHFNYFMI